MSDGQTAADLRRQLHSMKLKDREAFDAVERTSPMVKFTQSQWFTATVTGLAVFGLLYITNPLFVQEKRDKYEMAKPSIKRISAWSILVFLLVAVGPLIYQKIQSQFMHF